MNTRRLALFAPLTIAVGLIGSAMAHDKYPSGPVEIINPLPAGSSPDVTIRIVAPACPRSRRDGGISPQNRPSTPQGSRTGCYSVPVGTFP